MRRHVVLLISGAICFVLLALTSFAFVATVDDAFRIQRIHGQSEVRLHLLDGSILLTSYRRPENTFRARWDTYWISPGALDADVSKLTTAATTRRGFGPVRLLVGRTGSADFTLLRLPFWPLLLLLPIPPVWLAVVAYREYQRRGLPLCPVCGYDLSGCIKRCTECNWTMPYPLVLRLAIRREALRRLTPAEPAKLPASSLGRRMRTKPT
jgi:hypothetical protein